MWPRVHWWWRILREGFFFSRINALREEKGEICCPFWAVIRVTNGHSILCSAHFPPEQTGNEAVWLEAVAEASLRRPPGGSYRWFGDDSSVWLNRFPCLLSPLILCTGAENWKIWSVVEHRLWRQSHLHDEVFTSTVVDTRTDSGKETCRQGFTWSFSFKKIKRKKKEEKVRFVLVAVRSTSILFLVGFSFWIQNQICKILVSPRPPVGCEWTWVTCDRLMESHLGRTCWKTRYPDDCTEHALAAEGNVTFTFHGFLQPDEAKTGGSSDNFAQFPGPRSTPPPLPATPPPVSRNFGKKERDRVWLCGHYVIRQKRHLPHAQNFGCAGLFCGAGPWARTDRQTNRETRARTHARTHARARAHTRTLTHSHKSSVEAVCGSSVWKSPETDKKLGTLTSS